MSAQVPDEVKAQLSLWSRNAMLYMITGYLLAVAGTLCSLAVATFADSLIPIYIRSLTFVAAVSTALLAIIRPFEAANVFWAAWRVLNLATLEFVLDNAHDPARLASAVKEGHRLIAKVPMPAAEEKT